MTLKDYGWNEDWQAQLETQGRKQATLGRVCFSSKGIYKLMSPHGPKLGQCSGNLLLNGTPPVVGDWVFWNQETTDRVLIEGHLERKSKISRADPGARGREQILAANVDRVFLMTSMNRDFNINRLERYLTTLAQGGCQAVILLTKSDICTDPDGYLARLSETLPHVPGHSISALTGHGIDALGPYLMPGQTIAFLGSSGVGKSTLINCLMREEQQLTASIREKDQKGRHTTSHREMFLLQSGTILIDTPGLRELRLWGDQRGLQQAFSDIEDLATHCRFRDCQHLGEPGCAVLKAVKDGALSKRRLKNFLKMGKELAFHQQDLDGAWEKKRKKRAFGTMIKEAKALKNKNRR